MLHLTIFQGASVRLGRMRTIASGESSNRVRQQSSGLFDLLARFSRLVISICLGAKLRWCLPAIPPALALVILPPGLACGSTSEIGALIDSPKINGVRTYLNRGGLKPQWEIWYMRRNGRWMPGDQKYYLLTLRTVISSAATLAPPARACGNLAFERRFPSSRNGAQRRKTCGAIGARIEIRVEQPCDANQMVAGITRCHIRQNK